MHYIDVSHYDWDRNGGNLNWTQIKASGIDVVIIRASYGDPQIYSPETRHFREMALAAKAAGLKVGGYHNLIHGDFNSIQRQITYFRGELNSVSADYAMIDVEPYQALRDNDLWPRLADAELFAQEFSNVEKGTTSRKLMVYLPQWVWSDWSNRADLTHLMEVSNGPLVSSNYTLGSINGDFNQLYAEIQSGPKANAGWMPYGNVTPECWQYSSNATVPGASSSTDVNTYQGTSEEFDIRMAWVLTKNMQAFRDQMNYYFPGRDTTSDGTIGDYAHTQEKSGHNPDDTSQNNAEWDSDSDTKSEVRAIDIDSNTRNPDVSMEDIFQHLRALGKSEGAKFPVRYIIYNRRIARASNNWAIETYTGASAHTEHIHLSGQYSNAADENYYNYRLDELVALTQADKDFISSFFAPGKQGDGTVTSPVGQVTWNQGIPNPVDGDKSYAWRVLQRIGDTVVSISKALAVVASKVDLDPAELAAIKATLDVPTAEENATAVVSALSQVDTNTLVNTLKDGLTDEQIAALKEAL